LIAGRKYCHSRKTGKETKEKPITGLTYRKKVFSLDTTRGFGAMLKKIAG